MVNRLQSGDIAAALNHIDEVALARFTAAFNAVGAGGFTQFFASKGRDGLGHVLSDYASDRLVELLITRFNSGKWYAYRAYIMRSTDGLWRIVEM
jgi:hypothetical protein